MSSSDYSYILHKANTRGHADHGWLKSSHTFSFANYYDQNRINFGRLRVINDDYVAAAGGFGTHPHENMEIITIPLMGDLAHKDSMGNSSVIQEGDIQVMSAGTGITHSEYNHNSDRPVTLLQIWILPGLKNVTPRYQQMHLKNLELPNQLNQVLSPNENDAGVWIHQSAWFYLGSFDAHIQFEYSMKNIVKTGVYCFVIHGEFLANDQPLEARDGIGIWNTDTIKFTALAPNSRILLIEVPMH